MNQGSKEKSFCFLSPSWLRFFGGGGVIITPVFSGILQPSAVFLYFLLRRASAPKVCAPASLGPRQLSAPDRHCHLSTAWCNERLFGMLGIITRAGAPHFVYATDSSFPSDSCGWADKRRRSPFCLSESTPHRTSHGNYRAEGWLMGWTWVEKGTKWLKYFDSNLEQIHNQPPLSSFKVYRYRQLTTPNSTMSPRFCMAVIRMPLTGLTGACVSRHRRRLTLISIF